jgi:inorganic pyrophosphatase
MNLEKIEIGKSPDEINAVIEIPYNSNVKYEICKDTSMVVVDRILFASMHYPANYGFIPNTLAKDGDATDILVLGEFPFVPGSVVKCRLVGVLVMEDESGMDEKLLAFPISKIDPTHEAIKDIGDISKFTLAKIKHFFETYKDLEPNKWVKVQEYKNKAEAHKILLDSMK